MNTKVHSDSAAVAYASRGWNIDCVLKKNGEPYEYLLSWSSDSPKDSPNDEELTAFYKLSVVEDIFTITGRGTVIDPGIPREKRGHHVQIGDDLILLGDSSVVTKVQGIEMCSPPSSVGWPILVDSKVLPESIEKGMSVWVRNVENNQIQSFDSANKVAK